MNNDPRLATAEATDKGMSTLPAGGSFIGGHDGYQVPSNLGRVTYSTDKDWADKQWLREQDGFDWELSDGQLLVAIGLILAMALLGNAVGWL